MFRLNMFVISSFTSDVGFKHVFMHDCEFWFCIAMLYPCNRCHYVLRQCSPKYSDFYPSPIIAVVFLHRPIFQLAIWPQFWFFWPLPSSPHLSAILNVCGLIMNETTSRGCFNYAQNNHVSNMIRAMHCLHNETCFIRDH